MQNNHLYGRVGSGMAATLKKLVLAGLVVALAACDAGSGDAAPSAADVMPQPGGQQQATAGDSAGADVDLLEDLPGEPAIPPARIAEVVSVTPVWQRTDNPREECRDEAVTRKVEPEDSKQIAGTVIGAIAGGVVGNQVGGGRGRDLATVAGAIGGGAAGKNIQKQQQERRTVTTIERRCRTVNDTTEEVVAYDVVYAYLGQTHKVRLDHDPGDHLELPVRGIE